MTINNGDASWGSVAAQNGADIMDGTENRKYGFRWINQLWDLFYTRVFGIEQGGTGATTLAGARTALGLSDTGWQACTLFPPATGGSVRARQINGVVHVQGTVTISNATFVDGDNLFMLPAAMRPAAALYLPSGSANGYCTLNVPTGANYVSAWAMSVGSNQIVVNGSFPLT